MSDLSLRMLRKCYGKFEVIPPLDLDVRSGEFLVLVGPSGSGKSTLLRMIAGLEDIDAGKIVIDGEDVTDRDAGDRDMAMVFQSYALYPHMTVAENMTFALRMRDINEAEINRRLVEALRMLSLEGFESRKPGQLSGGQRQRVAMGRAIVRQPRVFLFDEPLSNLDAKLRARTRIELRELHERLGATSILVTHDQIEAMTMADRIVLLDHGRIQQIGSPREIYQAPRNRFVATFIGSPEINILEGRFYAQGDRMRFEDLPIPAGKLSQPYPDGTFALGIRPEAFSVLATAAEDTLEAKIVTIEYTGSDVYAVAATGTWRLTIKLPTDQKIGGRNVASGDTVHIRLANDGWHLFDPSGARVE